MSRMRAGAARPTAGVGGAAVDVIDRLTRQVGRFVSVTSGNVELWVPANPGFVDVVDRLARQEGRVVVVNSANTELGNNVLNGFVTVVGDLRAGSLHQNATGLVNTAVTLTLPSGGAGLFHYITSIELVKLYAVVGVANGAGVIITSTNLPSNPAWTTEQNASPAGTVARVISYQSNTPLKSLVAATNTTFVAPAQLQTIWRWNVSYFLAN